MALCVLIPLLSLCLHAGSTCDSIHAWQSVRMYCDSCYKNDHGVAEKHTGANFVVMCPNITM